MNLAYRLWLWFFCRNHWYYDTKKINDTPTFNQLKTKGDIQAYPIKHLIQEKKNELIRAIFVNVAPATVIGMIVFIPLYISHFTHFATHIFSLDTSLLLCLCISIFLSGYLCDRIGTKNRYCISLLIAIGASWPLNTLICHTHNYTHSLIFFGTLGLSYGCILGCFTIFLFDQCPAKHRTTGIGIRYNIAFAILTGSFPVSMMLLAKTAHGTNIIPISVILLFAFSLPHLILSQKKYKKNSKRVL